MTAGELAWRMHSAVRDVKEHYLQAWGIPHLPTVQMRQEAPVDSPGYRVSDMTVGEWTVARPGHPEYEWYRRLIARADRIANHQLSFFGLKNQPLGPTIDWNYDYKHRKASPKRFSPLIDYRNFQVTGDAKFVWEPNRHHQLVVLARAYRAGGSQRYAQALCEQLTSWLDQCPFGMGMNWRSPLELAVRLINWVWAIDLTREAGIFRSSFRTRLLQAVYLHLWEITRKYSRGSSTNNHLVGEAAGVFIAASYFTELADTAEWRSQSRDILCREIIAQTYPDGGSREQALGYLFFVMQFFLLAGLVGIRTGSHFPEEYWRRLEKMFEFAGTLCEGGHRPPMFGDCDDGYVLDLGANHGDILAWMPVAALILNRSDFRIWAPEYTETTRWLLGRESQSRFHAMPPRPRRVTLASRAFPASGYYLLQYGTDDPDNRISIAFDCGDHGLKPLAGHGHADALSFTLRAFGEDVLVDPGTYDYFTFPSWREYFRSTWAHNTATVDQQNQSEIRGPFLWGSVARARCCEWNPTQNGGTVAGEHDGYMRLGDPVMHRRHLQLDGRNRRLVVRDIFTAERQHDVALHFHLAEDCRVAGVGPGYYLIDAGPGMVKMYFDERMTVQILLGSDDPIGGWVSRGYHHKSSSTTFVARCSFLGELILETRMEIGERW